MHRMTAEEDSTKHIRINIKHGDESRDITDECKVVHDNKRGDESSIVTMDYLVDTLGNTKHLGTPGNTEHLDTPGNTKHLDTQGIITEEDKEHHSIESLCIELTEILPNCNESNRLRFKNILQKFKDFLFNTKLSTNAKYIYKMIDLMNGLNKTGYYHFYSDDLYNIYICLFNRSVSLDNQVKLSVFNALYATYDKERLFMDILSVYNVIDNFYAGGVLFRNYMLKKIVCSFFERRTSGGIEVDVNTIGNTDVVNTIGNNDIVNSMGNEFKYKDTKDIVNKDIVSDNTKNVCKYNHSIEDIAKIMMNMASGLDGCHGFVDFLCKNVEDSSCRSFLIVYSYKWLQNIKVDLCNIKNGSALKETEGKVIGKIFSVFHGIVTGSIANERSEDDPIIKKTKRNSSSKKHQLKWLGEERPEIALLYFLFNSDSSRKIFASIYKRLFFNFLFQNKRIFTSIKILKVFNKNEIQKIYKNIRNNVVPFINVFKQLDPGYLTKELGRVLDIDIIRSIDPSCLPEEDLFIFYNSYFSILERTKACDLEVRVQNLYVFSNAFCKQIDRSFIPYVLLKSYKDDPNVLNLKMTNGIASVDQQNVSLMIRQYTLYFKHTFMDPVILCAPLLDTPTAMLHKNNVSFYNNIIGALSNITVSQGLRNRLKRLVGTGWTDVIANDGFHLPL